MAYQGLAPPPPTETLNDFRQREAENLVKIARLLSELNNNCASEKQSLGEQAQGHGHRVEEGFTQFKGIKSPLDPASGQPPPAATHEKLEYLSLTVRSSLDRIRALEASYSRLQKGGNPRSYESSPQTYDNRRSQLPKTMPIPPANRELTNGIRSCALSEIPLVDTAKLSGTSGIRKPRFSSMFGLRRPKRRLILPPSALF
ncbi:hypothetical protein PM082_022287 [Marasmius tenuissimus]|nr:hypothetical protein PM082_022287 [Marasmius tenuissimus]